MLRYTVMGKVYSQMLMSPMGRTLVYVSVFVAGLVLHELSLYLIRPVVGSTSSIALGLSTLCAFVLVGAIFVSEHHTLSRVSSAGTLLILGVIALEMGHTAIPDPYLLAIAFFIAFLGARTIFHRKLVGLKKTVLYSLVIVCITLSVVVTFTYGVRVANRIVIQQQTYSRN